MSGAAGTVRLLFLASVRDRLGRAEDRIALPDAVRTVAALLALLGRDPAFAALEADRHPIRVAVNQRFAIPEDAVRPGDEVALFPPVTGG